MPDAFGVRKKGHVSVRRKSHSRWADGMAFPPLGAFTDVRVKKATAAKQRALLSLPCMCNNLPLCLQMNCGFD